MKKTVLICITFLFASHGFTQDSVIQEPTYYPLILMDSPARLFTMKQVNQNYISLYRFGSEKLHSHLKSDKIADLIEITLAGLLYMPLTHEEGHRSILTAKNIGSISQPYINSKGAAYVVGVTDSTLKNLRDTDLPTYIRLHTAGLESDYMLTKRVEQIAAFEMDEKLHYKWEYLVRKFSIMQYFAFGLFKLDINLDEESNELERDIVGHDIYGAAKHLHRPVENFYRYTDYSDLTIEEKKFLKRTAYRSFFNLANPLILGMNNFKLNDNLKINANMGYALAPFGDFIDQTFLLKFKNKLNISFYLREYQNKENWFISSGIGIYNFEISPAFLTDVEVHFWHQPEQLDFNTAKSKPGGAIDFTLKYKTTRSTTSNLQAFSFDAGFTFKTAGFLPEEMYLEKHLGFQIGASVWLF